MAISGAALHRAADRLLEAALICDDRQDALEHFAKAAGAEGVTLVRSRVGDVLNSTQRDEFVFSSESILEPVTAYLKGAAPPDPRLPRVNPERGQGFVTDFDQFSLDEISRDPFYEEFLRPYKLRWHACACIDSSRSSGKVYMSLKRGIDREHYDPAEIRSINDVLPKVEMAAAVSRAFMKAEKRGMRSVLEQRGEGLIEFDPRGRVIATNRSGEALIGSAFGLKQGWLTPPLPEDNDRMQRAIAAALDEPPRVASVVLGSAVPDVRFVMRTMPVAGVARDVFGATAALATIIVWEKPEAPPDALVLVLRESFDVTGAEARVAALVGLGVTLADSARILSIGLGTARNYFKAAQTKIGVSRQAELASLVALMRP